VVEEIMRKGSLTFATLALAIAVTLAPPLAELAGAQSQPAGAATQTQVPQPQDNNVNWPGAGYGVGALFANVLYIPAKLVYALLGGIVGGGTYLITAGNMQAANTVWRSSLGGDYVVTPQMLAGQQPINFSGPTDTPPTSASPATVSSGTSPDMTTTASSGTVAPITPLPASGTSGVSGTSTTASTSTSASGGQPLDHGTGPASRTSGGTNIE
jgi:hypothetical protein